MARPSKLTTICITRYHKDEYVGVKYGDDENNSTERLRYLVVF